MSLRNETPCDFGECPYNAEYSCDCEYWCGAEEPEDNPEIWEDERPDALSFDPEEELRGSLISELVYLMDTVDPWNMDDVVAAYGELTVPELEEQIRQARECLDGE